MNSTKGIIGELEHLMDISLTRKALVNTSSGHWMPSVDIFETSEAVVMFVEIAGVLKKDIDVSFKEGYLVISGVRKELCCDRPVTLHRMEIDSGRFMRKIKLNIPIDPGKIEAEYKNGVLRILLPKEKIHG